MSIKQINNNINPIENLKPPENTTPFEKNSITPPDKIFSLPPPNEIIISLKKTLTSSRKKHSPPPDIITPSLKKSSFLRKNYLVPWKNLNLQDTTETSQLLWKNLNPCLKYFLSTKKWKKNSTSSPWYDHTLPNIFVNPTGKENLVNWKNLNLSDTPENISTTLK